MAGVEDFADELVQQRLVEDGEGRGEDKKVRSFVQEYVAWAKSNNPKAGDNAAARKDNKIQNSMNVDRLKGQLQQMEFFTKKAAVTISEVSDLQVKYREHQAEIRREVDINRQIILDFKQQTSYLRKLTQEAKEYEAMFVILKTLPIRKQVEARRELLKDELQVVQRSCAELESKIQFQKQKLAVLIKSSQDLAATLRNVHEENVLLSDPYSPAPEELSSSSLSTLSNLDNVRPKHTLSSPTCSEILPLPLSCIPLKAIKPQVLPNTSTLVANVDMKDDSPMNDESQENPPPIPEIDVVGVVLASNKRIKIRRDFKRTSMAVKPTSLTPGIEDLEVLTDTASAKAALPAFEKRSEGGSGDQLVSERQRIQPIIEPAGPLKNISSAPIAVAVAPIQKVSQRVVSDRVTANEGKASSSATQAMPKPPNPASVAIDNLKRALQITNAKPVETKALPVSVVKKYVPPDSAVSETNLTPSSGPTPSVNDAPAFRPPFSNKTWVKGQTPTVSDETKPKGKGSDIKVSSQDAKVAEAPKPESSLAVDLLGSALVAVVLPEFIDPDGDVTPKNADACNDEDFGLYDNIIEPVPTPQPGSAESSFEIEDMEIDVKDDDDGGGPTLSHSIQDGEKSDADVKEVDEASMTLEDFLISVSPGGAEKAGTVTLLYNNPLADEDIAMEDVPPSAPATISGQKKEDDSDSSDDLFEPPTKAECSDSVVETLNILDECSDSDDDTEPEPEKQPSDLDDVSSQSSNDP